MRISLLIFIMYSFNFVAQVDSLICIKEVLESEKEMYAEAKNDKTVFLNYHTSAIDWENNLAESEVKLYKNKTDVHFFSKEGIIYKGENEMFLVLPAQQLIVAEETSEEMKKTKTNDELIKLRERFLLSSELVYCKITDSAKGIKEVKLRISEELEGIVEIEEMIYVYNTKLKKMIRTTVTYSNDYKIKEMTITYLKYNNTSNYSFKKPNKYVLSGNKKKLSKYQNFELIDNRNN